MALHPIFQRLFDGLFGEFPPVPVVIGDDQIEPTIPAAYPAVYEAKVAEERARVEVERAIKE